MTVRVATRLCSGAAVLMLGASVAQAQPPSRQAHDAPAPDLEGSWTNETMTPFERPAGMGDKLAFTPGEAAEIEGEAARVAELGKQPTAATATVETLPNDCSGGRRWCNYNSAWTESGSSLMRVGGQARTSLVTQPTNGRIPFKAGRVAGVLAEGAAEDPRGPTGGKADDPEGRGLSERCLVGISISAGALLTPTLYNNNYQIVQNKDAVAIIVEMSHDVRIIRLNARHGPTPLWFGDSIGHYEGDTLVVETTNFAPAQLAGNSPQLRLTERIKRVAGGRLLYSFRVEDPAVYAQPWGGEYELSKAKGPLFEYACHEGNRGLEGILAGARADEAAARAGGSTAEAK